MKSLSVKRIGRSSLIYYDAATETKNPTHSLASLPPSSSTIGALTVLDMADLEDIPGRRWSSEVSHHYDTATLDYIHRAAETGVYDIRGLGAKRRVPSFDDLTFLTASMSRYPLEG